MKKLKAKTASLKIGDVVWIRDTQWDGSVHQNKEVMEETSRNWLLYAANPGDWTRGDERYAMRVPKTLRGYEIVTEVEAKRRSWALFNRYAICRTLDLSYDHNALIVTANLLKFEIPEDINVKAEASQSPAIEIADGDRGRKA